MSVLHQDAGYSLKSCLFITRIQTKGEKEVFKHRNSRPYTGTSVGAQLTSDCKFYKINDFSNFSWSWRIVRDSTIFPGKAADKRTLKPVEMLKDLQDESLKTTLTSQMSCLCTAEANMREKHDSFSSCPDQLQWSPKSR